MQQRFPAAGLFTGAAAPVTTRRGHDACGARGAAAPPCGCGQIGSARAGLRRTSRGYWSAAGPGIAGQLVQAVTVDGRAGLLVDPGNSYLMDRGREARKLRTDVPGVRQLLSPRRASSIRFTLSERSGLLMIQQITPNPRTARTTTAATAGVPIRES